jgi:hypothetical protein
MARDTASLTSAPDAPKKDDVQAINPQDRPDASSEASENVLLHTAQGPPTPQNPQPPNNKQRAYRGRAECRDRWKLGVEILTFVVVLAYTVVAYHQWKTAIDATRATQTTAIAAKTQGDSALLSAQIAQQQLMLSERPWIKIKHLIVKPLTFDHPAWKGNVATVTLEGTMENVGQSVALDVQSWEDIIPEDPDFSIRTARVRQNQMCDAKRHPTGHVFGYLLFPHDPLIQDSIVGPPMEIVIKAASASPLKGKVAFVMVGCVAYRVPFESKDAPRHETRFMYTLGKPLADGSIQPYVEPRGAHPEVQLFTFPDGFSAD